MMQYIKDYGLETHALQDTYAQSQGLDPCSSGGLTPVQMQIRRVLALIWAWAHEREVGDTSLTNILPSVSDDMAAWLTHGNTPCDEVTCAGAAASLLALGQALALTEDSFK